MGVPRSSPLPRFTNETGARPSASPALYASATGPSGESAAPRVPQPQDASPHRGEPQPTAGSRSREE
ncbi:hypothetical protein NDU88_004075 [Pleurodeles waltl]|uniref:Uncharacterized protein n=1 Tax=Pleurodeles waltl TaxID=8319 RepID=A0AAV7MUF3_PLEWA|nr:hypothetical protein NDU88_004075 [Pleurodeles waltl]